MTDSVAISEILDVTIIFKIILISNHFTHYLTYRCAREP